ncbi:MAG: hypothetical protein QHH19_03575 [Candidatus Thermoplasmatota archaeon]|jgi:archaellin|nr:hypothetical protein [Candidatus Thermoplasmatota archaeon]
MNKLGSAGTVSTIILVGFILSAIAVASIITGETQETTTEKNTEEIVNQVLDEITTYIQIKDQVGKFYTTYGEQRIEKIALLIKPLIIQDIDITGLTIKLTNGYDVKILNYSGKAEFIGESSLFEHKAWDEITYDSYGFIVTIDRDRSLVEHNIINGDMTYVIIKLDESFSVPQRESTTVTLFPYSGIARTTTLRAPLAIKTVVTFE